MAGTHPPALPALLLLPLLSAGHREETAGAVPALDDDYSGTSNMVSTSVLIFGVPV